MEISCSWLLAATEDVSVDRADGSGGRAALELDALQQHRLFERQPREERPPSALHGLRRL
jgi:hypothetical protein